jgi:hypothetical protein
MKNLFSPVKALKKGSAFFARLLGWLPLAIFLRKSDFAYSSKEFCASGYKLNLPSSNADYRVFAAEARSNRRTMLFHDRLFTIYNLLKSALALGSSDSFITAEVGVYRGGGSLFIHRVAKCFSAQPAIHFAIDTFEGHSEVDLNQSIETVHKVKKFTNNSFEDVKSFFASEGGIFPIRGRIQDVSDAISDREFNFVHLDMDLYEPTIFALRFFCKRMSRGGIILVDDYGFKSCPGIIRAVDEFCRDERGFHRVPFSTGQCALIIL